MIPFKTALAASRKLTPKALSLPPAVLHTEHSDGFDDTILTVCYGSHMRLDVDVRLDGGEPFGIFPNSIPGDTIKIARNDKRPPMVECSNPAGAVVLAEIFPAHKEIYHIDQSKPSSQSYRLTPTMLAAAVAVRKMAASSGKYNVALVVRNNEIVGAVATDGYALKIVGSVLPSEKNDWEIMIPPNVVDAMAELPPTVWELCTEPGQHNVLASSNDAVLRWTASPGARWASVIPRDPEAKQFVLYWGDIAAAWKKAPKAHLLLELSQEQQRWTFSLPRTDKQIKDKEPATVVLVQTLKSGIMRPAERTVILDPAYLKTICADVPKDTQITIEVSDARRAVVVRAGRASKNLAMEVYGLIMPVRPPDVF